MKSTSKKSAAKPRARRITFDQAFGPDPLGFKRLGENNKRRMLAALASPPTAEPTAEEDVIAEATRRAVVGKQRLPGKRRRRKVGHLGQLDRLISSLERKLATAKRAKVLILEQQAKRKRASPARVALSLAVGAPL